MPNNPEQRPTCPAGAPPAPTAAGGVLVLRHLPGCRPEVWQASTWEGIADQLQTRDGLAPYRDILDAAALATRWGAPLHDHEAQILATHGAVAECSGAYGHSYSCAPSEAPSLRDLILQWLRWDAPITLEAFEDSTSYAAWRERHPEAALISGTSDPVATQLGWYARAGEPTTSHLPAAQQGPRPTQPHEAHR